MYFPKDQIVGSQPRGVRLRLYNFTKKLNFDECDEMIDVRFRHCARSAIQPSCIAVKAYCIPIRGSLKSPEAHSICYAMVEKLRLLLRLASATCVLPFRRSYPAHDWWFTHLQQH
jgi:hypothetical protein